MRWKGPLARLLARDRSLVAVARRSPAGPVAILVGLALAVRLPLLGNRVAHWDEARVAWWILHYRATGDWEYHAILHGPFLFHVGRWLFGLLGASDAVMRLPTAVVGGALPAAALWYRDHLDDREVIALATVVAAAPLFVFYSRFMRNDLLVAGFAFAALGGLLRAVATGRRRYLLAAAGLLALSFTAKENAVLYPVSWAGAATLLAAVRWHRGDRTTLTAVRRRCQRAWQWGVPTATASGALFVAIIVVFYAPRTPGPASGFDDLGAHPELLPELVVEATLGSAGKVVDLWILGGSVGDYPTFLLLLLGVGLVTMPATIALAVFGALRDHHSGRRRPLVRFAIAWAALGVVGYPAAVDFVAGWTLLHVSVALTVPAAVGLTAVYERARPPRQPIDRSASTALVALLVYLVVVGGVVTFVVPAHRFNPYPQPAQPTGAVDPTADAVAAIAAEHPGTDAAFIGEYYTRGVALRQPLAWYVKSAGGTAVDRRRPGQGPLPPVVVVPEGREQSFESRLKGYICVQFQERPWTSMGPTDQEAIATFRPYRERAHTRVYIDRDALREYYGSTLSSQRCG